MIQIISLLEQHWGLVKKIYEEGIATGHATFQTTAPTWEQWNQSHLSHSRIVAVTEEKILGWAALTAVSSRCVYMGVAEVSVYVSAAARGKNVGSLLLQNLIQTSEDNGIWTLQSSIFPENKASVAIHLKSGFRIVGVRERIGKMNETWRDNLLLERRSSLVGVF